MVASAPRAASSCRSTLGPSKGQSSGLDMPAGISNWTGTFVSYSLIDCCTPMTQSIPLASNAAVRLTTVRSAPPPPRLGISQTVDRVFLPFASMLRSRQPTNPEIRTTRPQI